MGEHEQRSTRDNKLREISYGKEKTLKLKNEDIRFKRQ